MTRNVSDRGEPVSMVVLRRSEPWPGHGGQLGLRLRLRLRLARLGTPVLVVAALLFGAAVSATILVSVWSTEAGRRHDAETRLDKVARRSSVLHRQNASLRRQLADSRANTSRLTRRAGRRQAAARTLLRENAALLATASRLHGRGGSLERSAASVSRLTATLGNDLVAVLAYITSTSAGSLDPSYLKAQLDYLRPAVASARSAAAALGSEAGSYGKAVDAFSAEAGSYAAAIDRLAHEQASTR